MFTVQITLDFFPQFSKAYFKKRFNSNLLKCPSKNSSIFKCSTIEKVGQVDEEGQEATFAGDTGFLNLGEIMD